MTDYGQYLLALARGEMMNLLVTGGAGFIGSILSAGCGKTRRSTALSTWTR
jgi:hypothetical protein